MWHSIQYVHFLEHFFQLQHYGKKTNYRYFRRIVVFAFAFERIMLTSIYNDQATSPSVSREKRGLHEYALFSCFRSKHRLLGTYVNRLNDAVLASILKICALTINMKKHHKLQTLHLKNVVHIIIAQIYITFTEPSCKVQKAGKHKLWNVPVNCCFFLYIRWDLLVWPLPELDYVLTLRWSWNPDIFFPAFILFCFSLQSYEMIQNSTWK